MTLSTTTQLELHRMMMLIRLFEEALEEMFSRGLLHGTMHLSIGQEAMGRRSSRSELNI